MDKANRFSFAGILKTVLDVVFAISILWLALLLLAFLVTMIDPGSGANVFTTSTVYPLWDLVPGHILHAESSDPTVKINIRPLGWILMKSGNRAYLLMIMIGFFSWAGLFSLVILQLRRFLASVEAGNPFCRENASRIRTIGWSIIAAFLIKTANDLSAVIYMRRVISINGRHLFPPSGMIWESLHLEILFIGFVVLAISGIFRLGTRLKEEQELTI